MTQKVSYIWHLWGPPTRYFYSCTHMYIRKMCSLKCEFRVNAPFFRNSSFSLLDLIGWAELFGPFLLLIYMMGSPHFVQLWSVCINQ